jgi:hypothetical protein
MAVFISTLAALLLLVLALHVLDWPRPVINFTPVQNLFYGSPIPGLRSQLIPNTRSFHEFPANTRGYFGERAGLEYVVNSFGARDREYTREKPEGVLLLEHKYPEFSPDLVVIVLFLNDGHGGYSDEVFNVDVDGAIAQYSRGRAIAGRAIFEFLKQRVLLGEGS